MGRKIWPLVILCLLPAEICLAKKRKEKSKDKKESKQEKDTGPEIIRESRSKPIINVRKDSRDNRGNNHVVITPNFGLMVYPVPKLTFGISAGLLLFEQNAIMADFFHSSGTEYYNSSTVISEASCLSARFKRYFGNSINMEAGVTAKSINVIHRDNGDDGDEADTETETDSSTSTSESIDIKQNILTLGPQLTFGNQWQFSHFTIGGNWVEVFLPISVSQTTTGEDSLTERQRKRVYERGTQRADDIEFSARMFIGASF